MAGLDCVPGGFPFVLLDLSLLLDLLANRHMCDKAGVGSSSWVKVTGMLEVSGAVSINAVK